MSEKKKEKEKEERYRDVNTLYLSLASLVTENLLRERRKERKKEFGGHETVGRYAARKLVSREFGRADARNAAAGKEIIILTRTSDMFTRYERAPILFPASSSVCDVN